MTMGNSDDENGEICLTENNNDHMELKDYDPKREVYMAGARRKTSLSERKEIVEYCLSSGKNYNMTSPTVKYTIG